MSGRSNVVFSSVIRADQRRGIARNGRARHRPRHDGGQAVGQLPRSDVLRPVQDAGNRLVAGHAFELLKLVGIVLPHLFELGDRLRDRGRVEGRHTLGLRCP